MATVAPEPCDCPECSGEPIDLETFLAELTADARELLTAEDPLDVEVFGAALVAAGELVGEDVTATLAEARSPEALAMLLAIESVRGDGAAAQVARQLQDTGVPAPAWLTALSEPVTVGLCRRYGAPDGDASMLLCSFERAGTSHGFIVQVDHLDCDAATDILLFPGDLLDEFTGQIETDARRAGLRISAEDLDPGEFRWLVERALDARAVHDSEEGPEDPPDDQDGPDYPTTAVLLRARMRLLPEPPRPPAPHGNDKKPVARTPVLKLPAKRKKSTGPAPIYQVKVSRPDAEQPSWRRLELAADTSLAEVHRVIQVAFDWDDSELHVFDTPYGSFGVADRDRGHRAEKPVTLEQVAPNAGDAVEYLYDFEAHELVVEKALEREPVAYPRCTGGEPAGFDVAAVTRRLAR